MGKKRETMLGEVKIVNRTAEKEVAVWGEVLEDGGRRFRMYKITNHRLVTKRYREQYILKGTPSRILSIRRVHESVVGVFEVNHEDQTATYTEPY